MTIINGAVVLSRQEIRELEAEVSRRFFREEVVPNASGYDSRGGWRDDYGLFKSKSVHPNYSQRASDLRQYATGPLQLPEEWYTYTKLPGYASDEAAASRILGECVAREYAVLMDHTAERGHWRIQLTKPQPEGDYQVGVGEAHTWQIALAWAAVSLAKALQVPA